MSMETARRSLLAGVGQGKKSAVRDDPKSRGEDLHLWLNGVQIPQAAMNEDERLSLAAFKVMEPRIY
jgi:hypothetical protein